ncbi:hypothetical protein [Lacipirellula parvula]|uniref:PilZ domain-containing protein n=1 Tax=Lacipirellula parvula TaxID=2650471 RepID=A0A5K7XDX4_9BACT|nr:hypothetical protein [Lacipirellula parvula]BBO34688.1 hypothetical protein PLANPX_4300 [Lacipirellula parvula]
MVAYRKVRLEDIAPGSILAASLYDGQREKLLEKGAQLDAGQLQTLRGQGIEEAVIECPTSGAVSSALIGTAAATDQQLEAADVLGHGNCAGCATWHAFRAPTPRANAQAWYCQSCGAIVYATFDPENLADYSGVTLLAAEDGLIANLGNAPEEPVDSTPPEHLQRLVRMLTSREFKGVERRRYKRYAAVAPVVAVPLGEDFRVTGKPIRMTTTNVSHDGIGLIHTQYLRAPYYALDFSIAGLELRQAIVKLVRVRGLGPVYESGGRFVRGLSRKG